MICLTDYGDAADKDTVANDNNNSNKKTIKNKQKNNNNKNTMNTLQPACLSVINNTEMP